MKFKDETLKLSRVVDWTLDMLNRCVLNTSQAGAVRNMAYEDCVEALRVVGSERDEALERVEVLRHQVREWAATGGRVVALVGRVECSMASPGEVEKTVKTEVERLRRELANAQRRSDSKFKDETFRDVTFEEFCESNNVEVVVRERAGVSGVGRYFATCDDFDVRTPDGFLVGTVGNGATKEAAVEAYAAQLLGGKIVRDARETYRREIQCPNEWKKGSP